MMHQRTVRLLLLGWLAAFVASAGVRLVVAPAGDGFTRGMNLLGWLVAFQLVALALGIAAFALSRRLPVGDRLRRWVWGPLVLGGLFVAAMILPFVLGGVLVGVLDGVRGGVLGG